MTSRVGRVTRQETSKCSSAAPAQVGSAPGTVHVMLVTNHVLSGAVLGALMLRPLPAFAAGVVSHFPLDVVPHWGVSEHDEFLRVAVRDGLTGLAAMAVLYAMTDPARRPAVLAGMAGAAFPDLDKPSRLFFKRSPFPRTVDQFHERIQREDPGRMRQELVVGMALLLAAVVMLRRDRLRKPVRRRSHLCRRPATATTRRLAAAICSSSNGVCLPFSSAASMSKTRIAGSPAS